MPDFVGYENVKRVAEGNDWVVYSALREADQKSVVVKALRSEHPSPDSIALMYHEYEISKELNLPSVITTYELIDQQNQYALVQEDINGISLADYLHENPIKDLSMFFKLAISMTKIVSELHQHQVIHKDIKPSNFIINLETFVEKITGFTYSSRLLHEVQGIVAPNELEGTLAYMAPEQTGRMNMNIDYRSDFYALGIAFYEMLMGELPFLYTDPLELLHAHLANPPPDASNQKMGAPPVLVAIVKKLMAKNPRDRYQSAIGLQSDLERCQKEYEATGEVENFPLGQNDVFDRLNLSQKLYGREEEAKILLATYERVSQGAVEALMVCGYSGIGKTALINEVHKPMAKHKAYFISGKFDQLQRSMPYTAITQAFNQLARLILAEPEERFATIKNAITQALGSLGQIILDLAPDMALIIGPQAPLDKLPAQETQNRMMTFFKRFLNAVADENHPLVIFIDDLQWIDSGSLSLFEYIMTDETLSHVFLLGAYRDNEVDERHPLRVFFNRMEVLGKHIPSLSLAPLGIASYEALFQDTFSREASIVEPLAQLILKRTDGNPFFCKQVIGRLYKEKLLYFNYDNRRWEWDLEGITALKITDNVVDLMLAKLTELPQETQGILKYAACVGNRFTVEMLNLVSEKSPDMVGKMLWPALQEELIITLKMGYKRMDGARDKHLAELLSGDITYQFIHDRVQQAVYQGISQKEKEHTHLKIARLLMKKESSLPKKERLFEITDHFNEAHPLLSEEEKLCVVNLNYEAGLQAKNANAYQPMSNYLKAALDLMGEDFWKTNYELVFKVSREYALCLYLLNQMPEAEALIDRLLARAQTNFDKASLYRILIMAYYSQDELTKSLQMARMALALLGVGMIIEPSKAQLLLKVAHLQWRMRGSHVDHLDKELKTLTDPSIEAAFEILLEVSFLFYEKSSESFVYIILIAMDLQFRYGKPPSSGFWMVVYAIAVLNIFKNIDLAFQYWVLAERLLQESPNKYYVGPAYMLAGVMMAHLQNPIKVSETYVKRALQDCMESGNIRYETVSQVLSLFAAVAEAKSLKSWIQAAEITFKMCDKRGLLNYAVNFEIICILFKNFALGRHENAEQLKILEERLFTFESRLVEIDTLKYISFYYYFMENYEETVRYHYLWYVGQDKVQFQLTTNEAKTTNALALAKMIPQMHGLSKWHYQRRFRSILRYLKWVSGASPGNYLHHYLFLKGTEEKLKGNTIEALVCFNKAIDNALKGDFYLWVALGNELAGDLLMENNQSRAAMSYIQEAHYYYGRFGMTVKLNALEKRYPYCFIERVEAQTEATLALGKTLHATATTTTASASLDFMSIIKASQTISGEIVLDKLFEKMLHIAIENAGAEKALFIERRENTWMVTASLEVFKGEEQFNMFNTALKEAENVPQTIIQYAVRSGEPVVLDNAAGNSQYRQDAYIARVQPKSVLCLPILQHDKVIGVIYLENNLTIGAFTKDRVVVLTTLSSQIAISLENSHHLEQMERLYRSTERFVPKQFLEILDKKNIEEVDLGNCVKRDISVLFTDMRNFTSILEKRTPEEAFSFVNHYWEYMAPVIRQNYGFIGQYQGDAILALFPRLPEDAVNAGVAMLKALQEFNKGERERGSLELDIGVGINTGSAMLGIIGEKERLEPAVISDVTNTAARVESLNKSYGTHFLLSDNTINALSEKEQYSLRRIDKVQLKGRKTPTYLYELIDWADCLQNISLPDYLHLFDESFLHYERGSFKEAKKGFERCLELLPENKITEILIERCETFIKEGAPKDWEGTFTLTFK